MSEAARMTRPVAKVNMTLGLMAPIIDEAAPAPMQQMQLHSAHTPDEAADQMQGMQHRPLTSRLQLFCARQFGVVDEERLGLRQQTRPDACSPTTGPRT